MSWSFLLLLFLLIVFLYIIYRITKRGYWKRLARDLQPNSQPYYEESRYGTPLIGRLGVISYTLYGNYTKYLPQLLTNLDEISAQMPQWQSRVYVSQKVDHISIQEMISRGAEVVKIGPNEPSGHEGALWRYLPGKENLNFVALDADDPFDKKEEIWSWYNSGMSFGLFNKNQFLLPMTAGTTAVRAGAMPDIQNLLDSYSEPWFGFDEAFLYQLIWPRVQAMGYWKVVGIPWTGFFFGLIAIIVLLILYELLSLVYARSSSSARPR